MSIGTRIKERRKELKLTQGDLIKAVGIKQATLSELETGESSGSRYLASIAAALGVSAYWLETGKGAKDVGAPQPIQTEKKQHPLIQNVIELMEKIDIAEKWAERNFFIVTQKYDMMPDQINQLIRLMLKN